VDRGGHQGQRLDGPEALRDQALEAETGGPQRRAARPSRRVLVLVAASLLAAGVAAAVFLLAGGEERTVEPQDCRGLADDAARECYTRAFIAMVSDEDDPRPVVAAIADSAWEQGGFLLPNCHGIMHTVGRTYAAAADVGLATLMDYLPANNDPGCTAGFAHGLVTGVAPDIDPREPREATSICAEAGSRYQRYSCTHGFGHAFMRIHDDRLGPALALCRALGPRAAPDCAQGAYHDYWFAVVGADDARLSEDAVTDPRELCASQPSEFVRPCWYRAFVDNRPEGFVVRGPGDLDRLCTGLAGLQRQACMTAASVIGPPDPALQLQVCAGLVTPSDAESCIRGTKVQNLLGYPTAAYVDLIRRCESFGGAVRTACDRWLGKTLAVLTDGKFASAGCPQLPPQRARSCVEGARGMDDALVTFS
jgi:hypothetical protein